MKLSTFLTLLALSAVLGSFGPSNHSVLEGQSTTVFATRISAMKRKAM
jgi:hypothetical protein